VSNEAWLAMVMVVQDLLAWTATLCLDGALARAEPATLRYSTGSAQLAVELPDEQSARQSMVVSQL
jgi:hypothetical protein